MDELNGGIVVIDGKKKLIKLDARGVFAGYEDLDKRTAASMAQPAPAMAAASESLVARFEAAAVRTENAAARAEAAADRATGAPAQPGTGAEAPGGFQPGA
jgi:uncharacterized membrane-anchored protein